MTPPSTDQLQIAMQIEALHAWVHVAGVVALLVVTIVVPLGTVLYGIMKSKDGARER